MNGPGEGDHPLVSIVLPTYRHPEAIRKALASALSQSLKSLEVLVIDDSPDDSTAAVVAEIARTDERVRYYHNAPRLGFVKSLNFGLQHARGKYVARLDDDDLWADGDKLRRQVEFLQKHDDYVLTGGGFARVDETGRELFRHFYPETDLQIRRYMLLGCPFSHSTVVFRRATALSVGGYDESRRFAEDWDLWLRLGLHGKFYNFPSIYCQYADRPTSLSNAGSLTKQAADQLHIRLKFRRGYPNFTAGILVGLSVYVLSLVPRPAAVDSVLRGIKRRLMTTLFGGRA